MDIAHTAVIERIARVLAGQRLSINADGEFGSAARDVDDAWPDHTDDAIAVLRTLRAPDEDMAAVGDVAIWERMIAAALGTPLDLPPRVPSTATLGDDRPLASSVGGIPRIRPAGPDAIRDVPDDVATAWDEVDQNVDESFPASDPPGQGVG